jgi:Protein of unknown function (DUF1583)
MIGPTGRTQTWSVCRRLAMLLPAALTMLLGPYLHGQQPPDGEKPPGREVYQDFRGRRPLRAEFKLHGAPDVDEVVKAEEGGLRITLPATRDKHWPIEIDANFPLSGDFEITGTYELLSATKPAKGYGVGVSLNIASNPARDKFAKISRLVRAKEGSVHLAEYWKNDPPKDYKLPFQPTEAKGGQLRLVRKGASLRYLVSDAPGMEFREIFYQENFGAEDMTQAKYVVTDSGTPNNPVDVRLIDLRIRTGKLVPEKASTPAPLPEPAAVPAPSVEPALAPIAAERTGPTRGWLVALLLIGLAFTLMLVLALGLWFFLRQRRADDAAGKPAVKNRGPKQ